MTQFTIIPSDPLVIFASWCYDLMFSWVEDLVPKEEMLL